MRYHSRMQGELHGAASGFAEAPDGTRIHWSVAGDGAPALVCCDGIGCDGFAWKYIVRDFATRHRIVRWHYRGHGRSGIPQDAGRVGFDDISADLDSVLPATGTRHASEHPAFGHLPHVNVPTLIVAGTEDTFTPYWLSQEMHSRIPDAELLTVPGGTHVAPIEHPELITLRLEKFLALIPARGSAPGLRTA